MEDIQEQLAALRRRIARVDRRFDATRSPERGPLEGVRPAPEPRGYVPGEFIEGLMSGQVMHTPYGEHFETERLWERHRRHGSVYISDLAELPPDLLDPISAGAIARAHPGKWAFLDTETTGLMRGTGTY